MGPNGTVSNHYAADKALRSTTIAADPPSFRTLGDDYPRVTLNTGDNLDNSKSLQDGKLVEEEETALGHIDLSACKRPLSHLFV